MVLVVVAVVAFQGVPRLEGFVGAQLAGEGGFLGVSGHVPIVIGFGDQLRVADTAHPFAGTWRWDGGLK